MWVTETRETVSDAEAKEKRARALSLFREAIDTYREVEGLSPTADNVNCRDQIEFMEAFDKLSLESRRGSGRTTASLLESLAKAARFPDVWITACEEDSTSRYPETLIECLKSMAFSCGMRIEIQRRGSVVRIKSPLARLRCREPRPE